MSADSYGKFNLAVAQQQFHFRLSKDLTEPPMTLRYDVVKNVKIVYNKEDVSEHWRI